MARLIQRIDAGLELVPGSGFAEVILGDAIKELRRGEFGLILEGWTFSEGFDATAALHRIFKPRARKQAALRRPHLPDSNETPKASPGHSSSKRKGRTPQ
jgi:hypothetical protein